MTTIPSEFAVNGTLRPPSATEWDTGFPCGAADQALFNWIVYYLTGQVRTAIVNSGQTQDDAMLDQLWKAITSSRGLIFCTENGGTSTANARVLDVAAAYAPSAYTDGMVIIWKSGLANTGATTVNVSGLGDQTLTLEQVAMVGGELAANSWGIAVYEAANTVFRMPFWASGNGQLDQAYTDNAVVFTKNGGLGADPTQIYYASGQFAVGDNVPTTQVDAVHPAQATVRARTGGVRADLTSNTSSGSVGTSTDHPFDINANGAGRIRVETDGDVGVGIQSGLTGRFHVNDDSGETRFASKIQGSNGGSSGLSIDLSNGANTAHQGLEIRRTAANSASTALSVKTSGTADNEFLVSWAGTVNADGTVSGGGADFAEMFEWADGNPSADDRVGLPVVLVGDMIREAIGSDNPADIIGVISARPTAIGDTAGLRWQGQYLTDDYGRYQTESYQIVEWTESVPRSRFEVELDDDGKPVIDPETDQPNVIEISDPELISRSYVSDAVPEGIAVPDDAVTRTTDDDGNPLIRRVINPAYDPSAEYEPRAHRTEWDAVGLVGKLRVRTGSPVHPSWIKLKDISASVELYLAR